MINECHKLVNMVRANFTQHLLDTVSIPKIAKVYTIAVKL